MPSDAVYLIGKYNMGEDVPYVFLFFTFVGSFGMINAVLGFSGKPFMHKRKRRKKDELF